jgi:hypothetical protein
MISQMLLHIVYKHSEDIANRWMKDVQHNLDTISYMKISEDKLRDAIHDLLAHLGKWIENPGEDLPRLEEYYIKRGGERQREGFSAAEVVKAVNLAKQHLWGVVKHEGVFDSGPTMYQGLELLQDIGKFFDHVVYFIVVGFEREARVEAWKK